MTEQDLLTWGLSDGSRLVNPQLRPPHALELRQWVLLDGEAYRITNLRAVGVSGRLVEFRGHAPVLVTAGKALRVFTVIPPPDPVPGRRYFVP